MAVLRAVGLWLFLSVARWCLFRLPATSSLADKIFRPPTTLQALDPEHCPASCRELFPRLKCDGDCEEGMQHHVELQERGGKCPEKLELELSHLIRVHTLLVGHEWRAHGQGGYSPMHRSPMAACVCVELQNRSRLLAPSVLPTPTLIC